MIPDKINSQLSALSQLTDEQKLLLLKTLQSSLLQQEIDSSVQPITSIQLPKTNGLPSQVINLYVQMPAVTQNANPVIETKATADSTSSSEEKDSPKLDNFEAFLVLILVFFLGLFGIFSVAVRK